MAQPAIKSTKSNFLGDDSKQGFQPQIEFFLAAAASDHDN